MATTTTIRLTGPETLSQLSDLNRSTSSPKMFLVQLIKHLEKVQVGAIPGNLTIDFQLGGTAGVQASATATAAAVQANDTITIGGTALTAIADNGTPTAAQFKIGSGGGATQNGQCATNLAACINANTTLNKFVIATVAADVVTVKALNKGVVGNKVTFVSSNGTRLAVTGSGYLASGAGDDVAVKTYTFG